MPELQEIGLQTPSQDGERFSLGRAGQGRHFAHAGQRQLHRAARQFVDVRDGLARACVAHQLADRAQLGEGFAQCVDAALEQRVDELMRSTGLAAGSGIVAHNVLHDRSGFADPPEGSGPGRLLFRGRYADRVAGTALSDTWPEEDRR